MSTVELEKMLSEVQRARHAGQVYDHGDVARLIQEAYNAGYRRGRNAEAESEPLPDDLEETP